MARFRSRFAKLDDLILHLPDIARLNRLRPAQFINTETDCAFGEVQRLDKEPHRYRRGVPPARNQTFKHCLASDDCIQMKRLRIELTRERDNLLLTNLVGTRFESLTGFKIFEVTLFHCQVAPHSWSIFQVRAKKKHAPCLTHHCSLITYHCFLGRLAQW